MTKEKRLFTAVVLLCFAVCGCGGAARKSNATSDDSKPKGRTVDADLGDVGGEGEGQQPGSRSGLPPHVMSPDALAIYNNGVRATLVENFKEAEKAFRRVLAIDSKAYQAAYNLGVIAERNGDDESAVGHYEQAFDIQPNYYPALCSYANLKIRKGEVQPGLDLLRDKAGSYPRSIGVQNCFADILINAKRYQEAVAVAKQVLKLDERNAGAMLRIGKANLRMGRFELAESILEQVLKIEPDDAEAYFMRAFIRLDEGRNAAAIDDFKLALQKRPDYVEAMNNLATMYILSGNYSEAVRMLKTAIKITPSWGKLQLNYGNALRGAGNWKKAKEALQRAKDMDPALKGSILNMAILYYVAGDLDGMDRLARLKEAKRLFAQYKLEMGSSLTRSDQVFKYMKEVQIAIEREEKRLQREKARKEQETERARQREAQTAADERKEQTGEKTGSDDKWDDDDEGWE
jgi:tetratricopeptide (TPR) repeat protein